MHVRVAEQYPPPADQLPGTARTTRSSKCNARFIDVGFILQASTPLQTQWANNTQHAPGLAGMPLGIHQAHVNAQTLQLDCRIMALACPQKISVRQYILQPIRTQLQYPTNLGLRPCSGHDRGSHQHGPLDAHMRRCQPLYILLPMPHADLIVALVHATGGRCLSVMPRVSSGCALQHAWPVTHGLSGNMAVIRAVLVSRTGSERVVWDRDATCFSKTSSRTL
jgi:hypothetical protein